MDDTLKSRVEERLYYACANMHHHCIEHIVKNHAPYILMSTSIHCSDLPRWLILNNGFRALRGLIRAGLEIKDVLSTRPGRLHPDWIYREDLDKNVQVKQLLFACGILPEKDAKSDKISLSTMCRKAIRYELMVRADNEDLNAAVQQLPVPGKIKAELEGPIVTDHYPLHYPERNTQYGRGQPVPPRRTIPRRRPNPTYSDDLDYFLFDTPERGYILVPDRPHVDDSDSESEGEQWFV